MQELEPPLRKDLESGKLESKETSGGHTDKTSIVSFLLTFVVFVALPYELYVMGISILNDFALTVFAAGLLTDVFTTKAGLNRGYGDYNVFYNATKKKVKTNSFLIGITIFGAIRAYLMFYFWHDTLILLLVAMISLIGPLWNSVVLSVPDEIPQKQIIRQADSSVGISP
jgi:hypothetical protein